MRIFLPNLFLIAYYHEKHRYWVISVHENTHVKLAQFIKTYGNKARYTVCHKKRCCLVNNMLAFFIACAKLCPPIH